MSCTGESGMHAGHVETAADVTGDGKADILWQHDSGLPARWTMDGTHVTDTAVLPNPGTTGT